MIFRTMTLLGALAMLSGCAMFGQSYSKPDVRLADVQMLKANMWEQSFRLRLRVDNPNSRALPIRGMHYEVYLNDARLATGVTDRAFTVPAYGSEHFDLEVRSNLWRHLGDIVRMADRQQPVTYRIEGHINTGHFFSPRLTLREQGTLDPANMKF